MASPTPETASPSKKPPHFVEHIVHSYGDLLFDLAETVLWSRPNAQLCFRSILKELRRARPANGYQTFERTWVLRITCEKLREYAARHGRKLSPAEKIMLDAGLDASGRLKQFDSYFHRLPTDDQILLLLRDKHGLPYAEIASAMGVPEGSLKLRRQQALRTLEEWLW